PGRVPRPPRGIGLPLRVAVRAGGADGTARVRDGGGLLRPGEGALERLPGGGRVAGAHRFGRPRPRRAADADDPAPVARDDGGTDVTGGARPDGGPRERLAGRVAIVTGGGSGIGRAAALALARAGARIAVVGRDPARLRETLAAAGEASVVGRTPGL